MTDQDCIKNWFDQVCAVGPSSAIFCQLKCILEWPVYSINCSLTTQIVVHFAFYNLILFVRMGIIIKAHTPELHLHRDGISLVSP
jgi:hypothetical protein